MRLYKIQVESEKCIFSFSGLTLFYDKNISDSVFTLNFQTYRFFDMKNQYPPIVEKSLKVIEHLIEKFGWFTIRVYQFPLTPGFETFLESMQRNLIRHGSFSWYMWAKFKNKDMVLLVHFGRGFWAGHFESESDKIIPSLWLRQSQLSYLMADTITVDQQNKNNLQDWLVRFLISIGYEQTAGPEVKLRWHEKSFGTSQMKQIERKKSEALKALL